MRPRAPAGPEVASPVASCEGSGRLNERHAVIAGSIALSAATMVLTVPWLDVVHDDLVLGRRAAHTLLSAAALDTYARNPLTQMGPLAIALAPLPTHVYDLAVAALVGVVAALLALSRPRGVRLPLAVVTAVAWGTAVAVPWFELAVKGHVDDALVLLGTAVLLAARARGNVPRGARWGHPRPARQAHRDRARRGPAAVPSGVRARPRRDGRDLGPVRAARPGSPAEGRQGGDPRRQGESGGLAGVPRALPAARLGARPGVVAGVLAVLASLARDRVAEGIMLAFAVRALVEPNPAPSYVIPLVVLALVPDLTLGLPVFTLVSTVAFYQSQATLDGRPSWPRLVALVTLVVMTAVAVALPHDARPRRFARRPVEAEPVEAEPVSAGAAEPLPRASP